MITYRCKCGESIWYSSMGFADCEVCEKCGSTPATHPDGHADPEPHDFVLRYNEETGKASHYICTKCYKKKTLEEAIEKKP